MKKVLLSCHVIILLTCHLQAQNVGIGTTKPLNKLQVAGNLLVNEPLNETATPPTANQTKTLVNGTTITFYDADSTGRIYDPGGPTNNYIDGLNASVQFNLSYSSAGILLVVEDMDLAPGDSVLVRDYYNNPDITYFAFGSTNQATGNYFINGSLASITFKSNTDGLTGRGFKILFKRVYPIANQAPASGFAGKSLYFDVAKGALRAGSPSTNDNPGFYSVAIGSNNTATGQNAVAIGAQVNATGYGAVALGGSNNASGSYSTAFGNANTASGSVSTAFGSGAVADDNNKIAMGSYTLASAPGAIAMGSSTEATGYVSTAMGYLTKASFNYATAMGELSVASGEVSTAMGFGTTASGTYSLATGTVTTASGTGSTAMGNYVSTSNLSGAFAIGDNSTTTVMQSFAANGYRARFAGGYRLFTTSDVTVGAFLNAGANSWAALSDKRMKENFVAVDGEDFLHKISKIPLTTWNYIGQDVKTVRHYGPMAQDFFAAFGKDKLGVIGCDTLINQQDFLGVNLIAIQALEKRTAELNERFEAKNEKVKILEEKINALQKENEEMKANNQSSLNKRLQQRIDELEMKLDNLLKKVNP